MIAPLSVAVEPLGHEVLYSVEFEQAAFARLDSCSPGLLHDLILASSPVRIFRRSELDDPMLEPVRQPPVAGKELVRLPVPPDNGLGLSATGRNSDAQNAPQSVVAGHLFQRAVEDLPRFLRQFTHVQRQRLAAVRIALRLIAERAHSARPDVRKPVKRRYGP